MMVDYIKLGAWLLTISAAFVAMLVSFVGIVATNIKMLRNIKPGVSIWRDLLLNPFNIFFRPSLLLENGLVARRKLIYSIVVFAISGVILAICSKFY